MVKRKKTTSENPYNQMGKQLKFLRKQNNLTISQVAELLDLSDKIISNYENGYNYITIETIIKIYKTNAFGNRDLNELLQIFIIDIFED